MEIGVNARRGAVNISACGLLGDMEAITKYSFPTSQYRHEDRWYESNSMARLLSGRAH